MTANNSGVVIVYAFGDATDHANQTAMIVNGFQLAYAPNRRR